MWKLLHGSCFETLLNQGLVITKDTCEATITKMLAWLVGSLTVSSHEFFFLVHFVLEILSKTTNIFFSMFPTSLCFTDFSFHSLFSSFHSFKHWRTFNIHVNIPCKLLSLPILVDSTRFSLYAITKVSRKPKQTHFKSWFQNIHFSCAVFSRSNFCAVAGDGNDLISRFC